MAGREYVSWTMENAEPTGKTYQCHPRTWGLRLSGVDATVLALTAIGTVPGWHRIGSLILLLPFVVGHFFLFCNVFRIRRKPELVWGSLFLFLCLASLFLGEFSVSWLCGLQLGVTLVILFIEVRHPRYHGIFARTLNPRLEEYLQGRLG